MNKTELVAILAGKLGTTKVEAKAILEDVLAEIVKATKEGSIRLPELGKFETVLRAEREGRNPKTGETITIPSKNVVKFKASKAFKDAVL